MAPHLTPPPPDRRPPQGVPRWLWPPPGASVRSLRIEEHAPQGEADGRFEVLTGGPLEPLHLRALQWLLEDHECHPRLAGVPFTGRIELEVARTVMPQGRVGHAYALNRGPLGAPGGGAARGLLLRYLLFALRQA